MTNANYQIDTYDKLNTYCFAAFGATMSVMTSTIPFMSDEEKNKIPIIKMSQSDKDAITKYCGVFVLADDKIDFSNRYYTLGGTPFRILVEGDELK